MRASAGFLSGGLSLVAATLLADQAYARAEADLMYSADYLDHVRTIDPDETRAAQQQLENAQRVADAAWSTRNLTLGLTAALWAYNLFDAVYFSHGPDTVASVDPAPTEPTRELSALVPIGGRVGLMIAF
jgi:hypothetical protein